MNSTRFLFTYSIEPYMEVGNGLYMISSSFTKTLCRIISMKWIIGRFWNNLRSKLLRRFDILISWMWWSLKQTLFSSWLWRLFKGVDETGCCSSFGVFNPMLDMGLGDLKLTHAKTNKIPMKISTMRNKAWTPMAWNGNIQNIKKIRQINAVLQSEILPKCSLFPFGWKPLQRRF